MLKGEIDGARLVPGAGQMTIDSPVPTPIVFVPGVMGSRLKLGNDSWDPDSTTGMLGWSARDPVDAAALLDIRGGHQATIMNEPIKWDERLAPIWKLVDPKAQKDFYGNQRGWSGVAREFYYELLVSLEVYFNSYPFVPGAHPVYASGYDWRKSNADSGKKLATKIDEIIKKHPGATKVVLVTHSMGGLVARHAVHAKGGNVAAKVKGVVHVMQPINGAVQAYRRFAEGLGADKGGIFDLKSKIFAGILGGSWWGYTLLMSGTDGPLQLLPNQEYNSWLVHPDGTPVPAGNIYDYYSSGSIQSLTAELHPKLARKLGYRPIGDAEDPNEDALEKLILTQDTPWGEASEVEKTRAKRVLDNWHGYVAKLKTGLRNARDFHEIVKRSAHRRSFLLYAGERKTEVGYNWSKEDDDRIQTADEGGDGTVPVASAKALDRFVEKTWGTRLPGPIASHRNVGAQEHSEVFADANVVDQVQTLAFFLIRFDKEPDDVQQECVIQSIEVQCEHAAQRAFKMKLPAPKDMKQPVNVLEIVASSDAEKISTAVTFASPRCAKHTAHVLKVSGPASFAKTFTAETSSVDLTHPSDLHDHLLTWLWPWSQPPVEYKLLVNACHSPASTVLVRVYPAVEPSITFEFALDTNDRVKKQMAQARGLGYVDTSGSPAETQWKLEFSAKMTYGKRVFDLSLGMKGKIEKLASINALVKKAIDKFSACFYKYTGVTIYPVFPKLSLKYDGKFKEIEKTGRVGAEWGFTFKASPFIGITAKIDALKAMISALKAIPALTGLANGLDWLRTKAKEHDQTFDLTLSFSGTISGEVSGKKSAKGAATFNGSVTGKVVVELAAKVALGGKAAASVKAGSNANDEDALGVEVGGEAKASTGLFVKLTGNNDEKGVYCSGKLGILGCKLEFAAWASVKVFWEVKESYENEFSLWGDTDVAKSDPYYFVRREEAQES